MAARRPRRRATLVAKRAEEAKEDWLRYMELIPSQAYELEADPLPCTHTGPFGEV